MLLFHFMASAVVHYTTNVDELLSFVLNNSFCVLQNVNYYADVVAMILHYNCVHLDNANVCRNSVDLKLITSYCYESRLL